MNRLTYIAVTGPLVLALSGCDLFTGPEDRVVGIIGYETIGETAAQIEEGAASLGVRAPPRDTVPYCPDQVASVSFAEACVLEAPDTVDAGVSFSVTVRTAGPGGCTLPDGAEVSRSPMMIEVVPYDRKTGPACADADFVLPRTVDLVFPEPGDGLLRVTGRVLIVEDSVVDEVMGSRDHPIVVR